MAQPLYKLFGRTFKLTSLDFSKELNCKFQQIFCSFQSFFLFHSWMIGIVAFYESYTQNRSKFFVHCTSEKNVQINKRNETVNSFPTLFILAVKPLSLLHTSNFTTVAFIVPQCPCVIRKLLGYSNVTKTFLNIIVKGNTCYVYVHSGYD